jgi:hypothetical protein
MSPRFAVHWTLSLSFSTPYHVGAGTYFDQKVNDTRHDQSGPSSAPLAKPLATPPYSCATSGLPGPLADLSQPDAAGSR